MNKLFKKIGNIVLMGLLAVSLTGGMLYSIERKSTAEAAFYPVQTKSVRLYSGISSVSTSARLRSFYDLSGSTKLTMSMFGSVGYVTFDPGTPKEESASFTGITDNGDGTQTLTGLTRGLLGRYPFGTGGVAYSHDANSYVVASNGADFYSKFAFKENNESVTGIWNFNTVLPISSLIATTSTQFVTKALLDGTIAAGVATSSETNFGAVWLGTALQQASSTNGGANQPFVMQTRYATDTPTSGCAVGYTGTAGAGCSVIATLTGKIKQTWLDIFSTVNTWTGANTFSATTTIDGPLYGGNRFVDYLASTTISGASSPVAVFISTSTNAVWATNANNATTSDFLGFVRQNVTNGATTSVQIDGVVGGFSGLTAGKEYYASTTGVLSTVYNNGTAEIYVGRAISSTQILLDRKGDSWQYLGSVSGTTVSFPLFARFAVTNPTLTFTNCGGGFSGTYSAQLVVYKIGMTSASAYGASSCSGGTTPSNASVSASVSGTTLTITSSTNGTASLSNTAYFYR